MSGVPIPESSVVAVPDGGKFAGIRMIVLGMPCASRSSQKAWPWRKSSTRPAVRGKRHRPMGIACEPGTVTVVDK